MSEMKVLTTAQKEEWKTLLDRCAPFDFYHLPEYHALAEEEGEGQARLFHFAADGCTVVLPLLLRSLHSLVPSAEVPSAPQGQDGWRDATSVYGYPGPVCSDPNISEALLCRFHAALTRCLRELGVVSVFSRLHPLLPQRMLLAGLGECVPLNQTVSVDLTLTPEAQLAQYRKSHRTRINKMRRAGMTCVRDVDGRYLAEFIDIYHETMRRVGAHERYFFAPSYFCRLWQTLGSHLHLFAGLVHGRPVCAGLFLECHGILQYHLGGTVNAALQLSPMTYLLNEVSQWATQQGLRVFHLGGGTTAQPDDSLLHYKWGFSDRRHCFSIWRWVLLPEIYEALCTAKARLDQDKQLRPTSAGFFPAYRCPTAPEASHDLLPV